MKTKTFLLLTAVFGIVFFSCNTKTGQKGELPKTSLTEDSIRKTNVQDSIEATQIKGYSVKKLSGKHKYGGSTKVEYQSLIQLITEAKEESEKEMWTAEKLKSEVSGYKRTCIGGRIRLDIERSTIGAANTKYFSIILKDTTENEVYRVTLDSEVPNASRENWWNIGFCYIDTKIKAPFYVYVVDELEETPFKFIVTAIKK